MSNIVALSLNAARPAFTINPNPVKSLINVYSSAAAGKATITVTDVSGKVMFTGKEALYPGQSLQISCAAFAKGIYMVSIRSAGLTDNIKIVKE